jgi:hypothetical protein
MVYLPPEVKKMILKERRKQMFKKRIAKLESIIKIPCPLKLDSDYLDPVYKDQQLVGFRPFYEIGRRISMYSDEDENGVVRQRIRKKFEMQRFENSFFEYTIIARFTYK